MSMMRLDISVYTAACFDIGAYLGGSGLVVGVCCIDGYIIERVKGRVEGDVKAFVRVAVEHDINAANARYAGRERTDVLAKGVVDACDFGLRKFGLELEEYNMFDHNRL